MHLSEVVNKISNVTYLDITEVHEPSWSLFPVFAKRRVQDHMSLHTIGLQQFFSLESKLLQLIEWSVEGGGERRGSPRMLYLPDFQGG